AVEDERARVAAGDRDAAVARAAAVAEDPQPLEVDGLVLVIAAQQRDGLAAGAGDGEAADGDELGLLQSDGKAVRTLGDGALQDDAADLCRRGGLDHDPI